MPIGCSNAPPVFAAEYDGIVNFSDPPPEALTPVSTDPWSIPCQSGESPGTIWSMESNPMHLSTPGAAHRRWKSSSADADAGAVSGMAGDVSDLPPASGVSWLVAPSAAADSSDGPDAGSAAFCDVL